jgi:hypothetical protein
MVIPIIFVAVGQPRSESGYQTDDRQSPARLRPGIFFRPWQVSNSILALKNGGTQMTVGELAFLNPLGNQLISWDELLPVSPSPALSESQRSQFSIVDTNQS